jgi:hypothetical protein
MRACTYPNAGQRQGRRATQPPPLPTLQQAAKTLVDVIAAGRSLAGAECVVIGPTCVSLWMADGSIAMVGRWRNGSDSPDSTQRELMRIAIINKNDNKS